MVYLEIFHWVMVIHNLGSPRIKYPLVSSLFFISSNETYDSLYPYQTGSQLGFLYQYAFIRNGPLTVVVLIARLELVKLL